MSLKKIALVTGGNRGIGLEVVRQFLARQFFVVLSCRNLSEGQSVAESLHFEPDQLRVIPLDVTSTESIEEAVNSFGQQFDSLDVLVNNAAILFDASEDILSVSEDILNQTWNTNSLGPLRVVRAFLPYLKKSDDARVVNVSSRAAQLKDMGSFAPAYRISKTALNAVTGVLSNVLNEHGIKVNSVSPGWIRTEMGGPNAPGTLEEGADTIVWVATEAPISLTGQFLRDREPIDW